MVLVNKHDPHSAACLTQMGVGSIPQVDLHIIHSNVVLLASCKGSSDVLTIGLGRVRTSLSKVFMTRDVRATGG